jgi:hypothetical protein
LFLPNAEPQVPIRSVPNQIRNRIWAALAALVLTAGIAVPSFAQERTRTLTLQQGLDYAVYTLKHSQPDLTLQLTKGLLQAQPKAPLVHYLQAAAYAQLDRPIQGRRAAARAYRYADDRADKYQAAQLAAKLAVDSDQPTLAQVWLRRTAIHAPSETAQKYIAQDYKALRRINPWSVRLRLEAKPSSNINNGSDTALQIIDGVPVTGTLRGGALALSGAIGVFDLATSYRLNQTQKTRTSLSGRLYVQRVSLSSDAKATAPGVTGSDYASTFAELSLRHAFAVGPEAKRGFAAVDGAIGTSWFGGERSYNFARLSADRTWRFENGQRLVLDALYENRFSARYGSNEADVFGVGARLATPLDNGDLFTVSMALRDTNAKWRNGTFRAASVRADYGFGRPIGPVQLSAGLVLGYADYPSFVSGAILVPGGRQDKSVYGDLNLFFDRLDYAGFAPMLRLRMGRKSSNDSRFDIEELSMSLGIQSKF